MGLDIVEFIMAVEEAHGVTIPNRGAERIATPRMLIDYLYGRLKPGARADCLSQRGFYALRCELTGRTGLPARQFRPKTELRALVSRESWVEVGTAFGEKLWKRLWYRGWLLGWRVPKTLGQAARVMAIGAASYLKPPPSDDPLWVEIATTVDRLIREHLPVDEYSLDDGFIEDFDAD